MSSKKMSLTHKLLCPTAVAVHDEIPVFGIKRQQKRFGTSCIKTKPPERT